eukprot:m.256663 g.256663  ORF g.256663 m.256663 type:complete len:603 (-) comp34569_c0_seq1:49-1857(-)
MDSDLTLVIAGGAIAAVVGVLVMNLFKRPEEEEAAPVEVVKKSKKSKKVVKAPKAKKTKPVAVPESSSEEEEEAPPTPPPTKKKKKGKKAAVVVEVVEPEPEPTKKKKKKGKKAEPEPEPVVEEETSKKKKKKAKKAAEAAAAIVEPTPAPAPTKKKKEKKEKVAEEDDWEMVEISKPTKKKVVAAPTDGKKKTPTKVIDLGEAVRAVIGKAGSMIKQIQSDSGAKMDIEKGSGRLTITGTEEAVEDAYRAVVAIVNAEASILTQSIPVPEGRVAALIGKGGEKIKQLQTLSGCFIKIDRETNSVSAKGSFEQIQKAKELIELTLNPPEKVYQTTTMMELKKLATGERSMYIVMGRGGTTIRQIESETGAKLDIDKETHNLSIKGDQEHVLLALQAVSKVLADNGNEEIVPIADKKEMGIILGKGGANIRAVQDQSGADCKMNKEGTQLAIMGTKAAVAKAKELVEKLKTGGPMKPVCGPGEKLEELSLPSSAIGSIIGRKGASIQALQENSGATIEIARDSGLAWIHGKAANVAKAKAAILEILATVAQQDKDRAQRDIAAQKNEAETIKLFEATESAPVEEGEEPWGGGNGAEWGTAEAW